MANHKDIVPFIKKWEGGYVNDPLDKGGETMQGITYDVWCSVFGPNEHSRFMTMSVEDWGHIYKKLFWDNIKGDMILSQRIANTLADWAWGSGPFYPKKITQTICNNLGAKLKADGIFGNGTLSTLNTIDEDKLYNAIVAYRYQFLLNIVKKDPTQARFIKGWNNRMDSLVKHNLKTQIS